MLQICRNDTALYVRSVTGRFHLVIAGSLVIAACLIAPIGAFSSIVIVCGVIAVQLTCEVWRSEKDENTLESLLATPLTWRRLQLGKAILPIALPGAAAALALAGSIIVRGAGLALGTALGVWVLLIVTAAVISYVGGFGAAVAPTFQAANQRVSVVAVLAGAGALVAGTCAYVVPNGFWVLWGTLLALDLTALFVVGWRTNSLDLQRVLTAPLRAPVPSRLGRQVRGQVGALFWHEWRYSLTISQLRLPLVLSALGPGILFACFHWYFDRYTMLVPVVVMMLGIPRLPINLTSFAIGGERVYGTFESLLATSISVRNLLLGKALLPIAVGGVVTVLSAVLTGPIGGLYSYLVDGQFVWHRYSSAEYVLIGCVVVAGIVMALLTGYFSLRLRTARGGLMVASLVAFAFLAPVVAVGLSAHPLRWAWVYLGALVMLVLGGGAAVSRVSREQLMRTL